jgi:hypothetical protein
VLFPEPATPERIAEVEALIDTWLAAEHRDNEAVLSVEKVAGQRQWFVRLSCEAKPSFGVLFTLGQRTLSYETYLMPAPQEQPAQLYEHLLVRNHGLYGCHVAIGAEDALYLVGQLDLRWVDVGELDRVLGTLYLATEQFFVPAMRIGFASVFRP